MRDLVYKPFRPRAFEDCYECGASLCAARDPGEGFYGQRFCSRACAKRFDRRMKRSQDDHARAGFPEGSDER